MATNLAIDDRLIEDAKRIGGHKTKKEAVYGEKTARVNKLIQDGKEVSAILKVLQSEYPTCDEKALRNLIYVQRYRFGATKKRKGGKRG